MTCSATVLLTVNVTTPPASDGPLAAEIVEWPAPCASATVLPATGLLLPSLTVTVIVEVVLPSATTNDGDALTLELPASIDEKATCAVWLSAVASVESVAV